jgi:two-component system sensor histidine kinase/response regulator
MAVHPAESLTDHGTSVDPQATTARPIDVSVLKALVGDDAAVISEFLRDFDASLALIAVELRTACQRGDATAAHWAAHKLKSSARAVGAQVLDELCVEIEQAADAGHIESVAALLPRFLAEVDAVDRYLSSL